MTDAARGGRRLRVLLVYGTRPEAIKLAPVVRALQTAPDFEPVVAVTGQHREMLDQVNGLFGIRPEHDLDLLSPRQSLTDITTRALRGLEGLLRSAAPDVVLVQGDTTTTFAGALAAFYARLPVAHLEAGLRTGHRYDPFPEEINRRLTSQLATLHLAPTSGARKNLLDEGVPADRVLTTGNTVIDALQTVLEDQGRDWAGDEVLSTVDRRGRRVVVVTLHRRESWGAPMADVAHALASLAREFRDVLFVFPVHKNPVVRETVLPPLRGHDNVVLLEPLSYLSFSRLLAAAHLVVTDSGGVQEEGPSLGVPVLVARETTERPEGIAAGTAALVGTTSAAVQQEVRRLLLDADAHGRMARSVNPYGDGRASERVLGGLRHLLHDDPMPTAFSVAPAAQD